MAKSRYKKPTESDILRLRDHCLKREANGNKPGGPFTDNVDLRRNILFYHMMSGDWFLYRNWRTTWNKRYPNCPVEEQGTLKPRKPYVSRRELDGLVHQLQWYDRCIVAIFYQHKHRKWVLKRVEDGEQWAQMFSVRTPLYISEEWNNSIDAYESLRWLYDLFCHSCPECGGDWREKPRYKDAGDRWHCGHCHATAENTSINGSEPALGGQAERSGNEPVLK